MMDRLQGVLVQRAPTLLCLQAGPVWLEIAVPLSTSQAMPAEGSPVLLWTHLLWREEGPSLFGFATQDERSLFRLLILVQGVGPRIALSLLSHLPPQELVRQIRERSVTDLTQVPGIGPKTAGRILVELGPRVDRLEFLRGEGSSGPKSGGGEDAVQALTALGYPAKEARRVVESVLRAESGLALDECIRRALRQLAGSADRS